MLQHPNVDMLLVSLHTLHWEESNRYEKNEQVEAAELAILSALSEAFAGFSAPAHPVTIEDAHERQLGSKNDELTNYS